MLEMNLCYDLLEIETSTSCFRTLIFWKKIVEKQKPQIFMIYEVRVLKKLLSVELNQIELVYVK
jgi:hypothetical protein